MAPGQGRHKLSARDLASRRGDRRLMALQALAGAARQAGRDKDVLPSLTPENLAEAWHLHPSSAFRVLERLRRTGGVTRAGAGLGAEYEITSYGLRKLAYLQELAKFHKGLKKKSRAAANPEE